MRLQHFIEVNIEAILLEWVAFARTRTGADGMNLVALRDHAAAMLTQIVADLGTPQSPAEQFEKSQGPSEPAALRSTVEEALHEDSAAETHGADRPNTALCGTPKRLRPKCSSSFSSSATRLGTGCGPR